MQDEINMQANFVGSYRSYPVIPPINIINTIGHNGGTFGGHVRSLVQSSQCVFLAPSRRASRVISSIPYFFSDGGRLFAT